MSREEAPDVSPTGPTPLAPQTIHEIAQAYANLAFDLHNRIPTIEARMTAQDARLDGVHGVALASHGLVSRLALRVEDIALRVGAKRTFSSGSFAAANSNGAAAGGPVSGAGAAGPVTVSEPLEIRTTQTKTGRHMIIDSDELDRLRTRFAEKDAEERGAKEALAQYRLDEQYRESLAESKRKRVAFWVLLATAICSAAAWALGHFSATPGPSAPPAGGPPVVQVR
jgi:hypothetical protein